jgi:hypothetical protein
VICTDRAKAMRPSMLQCLPLAQHRHDAWHILKNIHDNSMQSDMGSLLKCQKAPSKALFDIAMSEYREKYSAAAAYVDAIPHEYWTYYTAVLSANPFYLFGLSGSQSVEQEMGRLKSEAVQVRHQLPFQSVSNFIDHYARLIDARRRSCEVMVARENLFLTVYADMYTGDQITTSKGYGVRVEAAATYRSEATFTSLPAYLTVVRVRNGYKFVQWR